VATRIVNTYMDGVLRATETDSMVTQRFFRVAWMLDSSIRRFHPSTVLRIANAPVHRSAKQ
jgi:hypothetical protein